MARLSRAAHLVPDGSAFVVGSKAFTGLTPAQLRSDPLTSPTRGVRTCGTPTPETLARAVLAVAPAGSALSHVTAARALDLPTPAVRGPITDADGEPLHVTSPGTRSRRPGVVGHRGSRRTWVVRGLAVTHPVDTWRDVCADPTWSDEDLVVLADAVLTRWPTLTEDLDDAARTPGRGAARARAARARARRGSESAGETFTRLVLVGSGLPEPALNVWITDATGCAFARVDLLFERERVVVEYEGDHHRTDRRQFRKDIERTRRLEALGYRVIRVTAADLGTPAARAALVGVVREALAR